jgi:hypothetical protein
MNTVNKQEILEIIDSLPDYKLKALHPLLLLVSNDVPAENDDVLTKGERKRLRKCLKDYEKDPESFISIDDLTAQYERGEF